MILLQAMMALPFVLVALLVLLFVITFVLVLLFNYIQPKLFPNNPKYIAWYWIIILPILIMTVLIVYLMTNDEIFRYT
jgi:hypothetical protein